MDAKKQAQVADFQALYIKAYEKFLAEEGSLLEIFASVAGLTAAAAPEPEPVVEDPPVAEEKSTAPPPTVEKEQTSKTYQSSFALTDEVPADDEPKSSTRLHFSPGGKSSIKFGASSVDEDASGPKVASLKVMASPGGKASVVLGSGPGAATPSSEVASVIDQKKAKKLAVAISQGGKLRGVFSKFAGDVVMKFIPKQNFMEYAGKLGVNLSMGEVTDLYEKFINSKDKEKMTYSSFVRFVTALGQ
ncbi:hypothetical protein AAMO2058_001624000 [Amorphochlora amoebiformis]